MADERVEIEIVLDDGKVQKGFLKVQKQAKKTGKVIDKNTSKRFGKSFDVLTKRVAILGVAIAAAFGGRRILQAAQQQEDAVNSLNTALKTAGTFSAQASKDIQDFASSLQQTSIVGDETILQMIGLAQAFVTTADEAKELTKVALDFSVGAGIQFTEAVRRLGRGVQGASGDIANFAPEIRKLTKEQLAAGEATRILGERFSGAAESQIKTFSGVVSQLANNFGDLLENLGNLVTKSPAIISVLTVISDKIADIAASTTGLDKFNESVKAFVLTAVKIGQVIAAFVVVPIELVLNAIDALANSIEVTIKSFGVGISAAFGGLISFFAPDSEFATSINQFTEKFNADVEGLADKTVESFKKIGDISFAESFASLLGDLEFAVNKSDDLTNKIGDSFKGLAKDVKKNVFDITGLIKNNLANGIAGGLANIGASLVQGGNAFGNFAKFALGFLGGFAIQLGTFIISSAIAIKSLKFTLDSFGGFGGAIAAGAALIVIGGALKAFSGGPAAGGAGAGEVAPIVPAPGASPGDIVGEPVTTSPETLVDAAPRNEVNITIQGAIDPRSTAEQIAQLLNDFGDTNGSIIFNTG